MLGEPFSLRHNSSVHAYHSSEESTDGKALVQSMVVAEFSELSSLSFLHATERGTMFR